MIQCNAVFHKSKFTVVVLSRLGVVQIGLDTDQAVVVCQLACIDGVAGQILATAVIGKSNPVRRRCATDVVVEISRIVINTNGVDYCSVDFATIAEKIKRENGQVDRRLEGRYQQIGPTVLICRINAGRPCASRCVSDSARIDTIPADLLQIEVQDYRCFCRGRWRINPENGVGQKLVGVRHRVVRGAIGVVLIIDIAIGCAGNGCC